MLKYFKILFYLVKNLRDFLDKETSVFLYQTNKNILQTNYTPPPPNDKKHFIIVSLTTHNQRISHIHYVLDSLYNQTLCPDTVVLYLTKNEYKRIPLILEKFKPWLQIKEVEDLRSYKKFIPALQNANYNDVIVSLDDDLIYPPHLVSSLYEHFLNNENDLIAYCGFKNDKTYFEGIAGCFGILWNPKIFNQQRLPYFFDKTLFLDSFKKSLDDNWISLNCLENNIAINCIKDNYIHTKKEFIQLPNAHIDSISTNPKSKNYVTPQEKKVIKEKMLTLIKKAREQ